MKKRDKEIVAGVLVLSLIALVIYLFIRTGQIKSMQEQIAKLRAGKPDISQRVVSEEDIAGRVSDKAGTASFVENLFDAARVSGIKKHEVSTMKISDVPAGKSAMKSKNAENESVLNTYSLKITFEGNYRETSEYVREVQNIGQYKKIIELGMRPDNKLLKTDMMVQIFSWGKQDAAQ